MFVTSYTVEILLEVKQSLEVLESGNYLQVDSLEILKKIIRTEREFCCLERRKKCSIYESEGVLLSTTKLPSV